MLLLKNNNKLYFYLFSLIFLTTINNVKLGEVIKKKFSIQNITIKTNIAQIDKIIFEETKNLINRNIFYTNKTEILGYLENLNFLENINVKKHYPSTIIVQADKTNLIGLTYIDNKKYFLGANGNFILSNKLSNIKNLPVIFGTFNVSNFLSLMKYLENQNINHNLITKYNFHKNKRWDIYFENNILLKLPNDDIDIAINIYKKAQKSNKIKPNSVIDLRIPGRLIILNEKK